jgi:hypothetical protein
MSSGQQGGRLAYGEMIPKLEPDDTDGKPVMLTVRRVREQNMAPEGRREEVKLVIEFAEKFSGEKPDQQRREYIVNSTSYKTLCEKLGSDHNKWAGESIVMAPTNTEFGGRTFEKMHVASPDRWDKVVQATTKARGAKAK